MSRLACLRLHRDASRRVIRIASPVVFGSLSLTLLSVVDTIMLGRLGSVPLAASGVAAVLFQAISFPLSGIGIGVQTLVARRYGEGKLPIAGEIRSNGLVMAFFLGVPLFVAAPWLAEMLSPILSSDAAVVDLGGIYLQYRFYGAVFIFLNWVFRGFFAALGETRHQMAANLVITAVNIVLDYLLIFGVAGFPALGIQGASIASSIALGSGTLYFAAAALLPRFRSIYGVFRPRLRSRDLTWPIVRLSVPVIVQRLVSHASWFAFFLIVARIGTLELAATNVIRSAYSVTIMIAIGLGTAAAALVGQNLGAKRPKDAELLAIEATKLAAYGMGLLGLLFLFFPGAVMRLYTSDAVVIALGRFPLIMLGWVQAAAGIALVLSQSLQGAGNTRFVMGAEIAVCIGLYLPVVYVLGLRTPLGLNGAWTGEYVYWIALTAIMIWKFRQGDWKSIVL